MMVSLQVWWCLYWFPLFPWERWEALRADDLYAGSVSGGYNAGMHKEEITAVYLCIIFSIWSTWIPELLNQEVKFLAF